MSNFPLTTPITLTKSGQWVAHAVAFDLVATADEPYRAVTRLRLLLACQIAAAFHGGGTLRNCYFAAPANYWMPPFKYITISQDDVEQVRFGDDPRD